MFLEYSRNELFSFACINSQKQLLFTYGATEEDWSKILRDSKSRSEESSESFLDSLEFLCNLFLRHKHNYKTKNIKMLSKLLKND